MQPITLGVNSAAEALGIGRTKLYQLLDSGAIRSFLLGNRRLVFTEDVIRFVETALAEGTR